MMYALTLLILVVHSVHGQNCGQCTVTKHKALDDHISPSYQLWTRTNSLTVAECGAGCYMDVGCRSFIYKGATTTCTGYASSMSTPTRMGAVAEVGARAYLMCTASLSIGHSCSNNDECSVTNSMCNNGACDCDASHYYDIHNNECTVTNLLASPCAVDSDCPVTDSICDNATSLCACNHSTIYNQTVNQCVESSHWLGQSCSGASECTVSDAICNTGLCACKYGYTYDTTTKECRQSLHDTCGSTSGCSVANSFCRSGSCVCDVGYSFKRTENQCDRFCTVYGDSYAGHVDVGVGGCNLISVTASTAEDCWKTCTSQTGMLCKNVEYNEASGSCILCDKAWFELSPGSRLYSDPGWTTYFRNCGDSTTVLGKLCSSNTDCSASNVICKSGTCVCTVGYSFNVATNGCVQLCSAYSDTYVGHSGVRVDSCNIASTTTTTAQACWERCTAETGTRCKIAQYRADDEDCILCDKGWFEILPDDRMYDEDGWTTYFRNCE
ncbi:cell-cell adhesion glycoprotein 64-like [Haliotis cracherodii]|uniref:cell-cell adhesion glycoprotein 64-like n=1 Tax=Haliotis cracherodii TaxID=6455 RepID=UPI0039E8041E